MPNLIQVVFEADQETHEYRAAHTKIADARAVYFLGFGYHFQNMERLKISAGTPNMRGSAYGMKDAERNSVRNKWGVDVGHEDHDALAYLRSSVELA